MPSLKYTDACTIHYKGDVFFCTKVRSALKIRCKTERKKKYIYMFVYIYVGINNHVGDTPTTDTSTEMSLPFWSTVLF